MQLSLMITCLGDVVRPEVGKAVVRLLRRLGHEVDFPQAQTCCGQPFYNSGFSDLARAQAQHTIEAFAGERTVVVPSGSCAAMVKVEYPHLFEEGSQWHRRAVELASEAKACRLLIWQALREIGFTEQGNEGLRLVPAAEALPKFIGAELGALKLLGLERRAKQVPNLDAYLEARTSEESDGEHP